jgi:hypothetical protein
LHYFLDPNFSAHGYAVSQPMPLEAPVTTANGLVVWLFID